MIIARPKKKSSDSIIKEIKRKTRRKFSSEEKIRIVIEGLKGEDSITGICRREGIAPALYYRWSKDFIEAGKKRLNGDTQREANTSEVNDLRKENTDLKEVVAELTLSNRVLKKKLTWAGVKYKKFMRFTQQEKYEIIRLVEDSEIGVSRTLLKLGIHKSTFYNWYGRYKQEGYDGLAPSNRKADTTWNKIPDQIRSQVVDLALELPELSPRELAYRMIDKNKYYISESSVYRILKSQGLITSPAYIVMQASNEFKDKTVRVNQMWQTDFTYFKIIGWGWYYLSTVMDDYSRYIIHWELYSTMKATDAERTLQRALDASNVSADHMPKLLSDNGSCYISNDLKEYLEAKGIDHVRGAPNHPQTQGKIERYHRSMKNVVKLENYYTPEQLTYRLEQFVEYYNNHRYHESLKNTTPSDMYFGRQQRILEKRKKIKHKTMKLRRKNHFEKVYNL